MWMVSSTHGSLLVYVEKEKSYVIGGDRRVLTDFNKQIIICHFISQVSFQVQVP
jgi:hypothetical protein